MIFIHKNCKQYTNNELVIIDNVIEICKIRGDIAICETIDRYGRCSLILL